jgi:2-methylisocitrate lyase-like PEP mutase family enzyme
MDKNTAKLRKLISGSRAIMAPGVADAMNARIVATEGFDALYMTGSGTASVRLGMPDVGLLTMTEMVDNAQRIADSVDIPLIADADTGYGGPINVIRTVRSFESAGVAAIHIEDQQWPKRCGHFSGKSLISKSEMVGKIKAAVDAKRDKDFIVIARTDAYSVEGYNAAIDRASSYVEAGADMIFVEELRTVKELSEIPITINIPALYNMGGSGKTPFLSIDEISNLGYKIVIYPNFIMRAAIQAVQNTLRQLKSTGSIQGSFDGMSSWDERHNLLRIKEIQNLEKLYVVDENTRVGINH